MAILRCQVQRRITILIQSNNKYTVAFTFRLEITLPTILISTNYTFTLSSNLQLQITNTINHYIANYKSRIENTTQAIAIAKVTTAMRSNSMKANKTLSKENIKLHEFVAMKSLIYIFSNIWFNNKQIFLLGFICSFHLIWFHFALFHFISFYFSYKPFKIFENNLTWKSTPFSIFERSCHKTGIVVASEENTDINQKQPQRWTAIKNLTFRKI